MNISELSRKININSAELLEILPEFGFDIGKRAIKVDDRVAQKILGKGQEIREKLDADKQAKLDSFKKVSVTAADAEPQEIKIPAIITVRDFAQVINQPVNLVIKELMKNGVLASLNQRIDFETAAIIADELGIKLIMTEGEEVIAESGERIRGIIDKEKKSDLKSRPPVVVVMGHVDHGKTKLLDTIRTTNVVAGEAGGITQHIGAYQVKRKDKIITFIDTPGHEAFTAMRSRGAKVADVAILVVAANDSVKPQTVEAIKIIQQSKIPMIVAINKTDLPDANIEKVKQDLSSLNLIPEDWGGKTITVPISAKNNLGIDDLLETILLVSEMEKDKIVANPDAEAVGTIIEAHISKGEGPVATLLIQNGTLKLGQNLCINGVFFGKARALKDYLSQDIAEAKPSNPVKVIGLKYSPKVGDIVEVVCDVDRKAKKAKIRTDFKEESSVGKINKSQNGNEESPVIKLNVIIKADVLGSLEVISESFEKIETSQVKINIVGKGLGNINDSDVNLAATSKALLIGFNVKSASQAEFLARDRGVEIKYYQVIYKLLDEIKERMSALIPPEVVRKDLGQLLVLAIFKTEDKQMIVGCKVLKGTITKGVKAEVTRKQQVITSGEISELQSGKQIVNEVAEDQDCGIKFIGRPEIQVNDILNVYQEEIIKKNI